MSRLTFTQCFGTGATQDSQFLIIQKSDLPGLIADSNNRAEQLLAAILFKIHEYFEGVLTDPQGQAVVDSTGVIITYDNSGFYELLKLFRWDRQFINRNQQPYVQDTIVCQFFLDASDKVNAITLNPQDFS